MTSSNTPVDGAAPAPLVSVILPTRNRLHLLPRAVASVLAQTLAQFELIVVNDASTDGTREWLDRQADPRIRVLHRERNAGAAAARNAGLSLARGDLAAFLDDDDFWLARKLELQTAALARAPAGTGWCLCGYINLEPSRVRYFGGQRFWRELDYRRGVGDGGPLWWLIATPGWLVRRDALLAAGLFDEGMRSWDDWELGLRLSKVCERVFVDEPLYVQDHINGSGMMRAERARADDLARILERHGALWANERRVMARHLYVIGRAKSLYDPAPAGRRELWQSVRLWPFRPMTWGALAMALIGTRHFAGLTRRVRAFKGRMA